MMPTWSTVWLAATLAALMNGQAYAAPPALLDGDVQRAQIERRCAQ